VGRGSCEALSTLLRELERYIFPGAVEPVNEAFRAARALLARQTPPSH
jgi:hypothetical protein